jgi:hypothetical protein
LSGGAGSRDQEALRASAQRYQSLFSLILNGLAHWRMTYDDERRPVDFEYPGVNDAFGRLTGRLDVVGKRVTEVVPGIRERSLELSSAAAALAICQFSRRIRAFGNLAGFSMTSYTADPKRFGERRPLGRNRASPWWSTNS